MVGSKCGISNCAYIHIGLGVIISRAASAVKLRDT